MNEATRILLVDLNNFARYPTSSIGYLASVLRNADMKVSVFSPLRTGIKGVTREPRSHLFSLTIARMNYLVAMTTPSWIKRLRESVAAYLRSDMTIQQQKLVRDFEKFLLEVKPHLVLVSTYLMYRDICESICAISQRQGIPVVLGGPYFAQTEIVQEWIGIKGLRALIAGEVELQLPSIVRSLLGGEDLSRHPGVLVAGGHARAIGAVAPPLTKLDDVPFPDFSDFPWDAYPNRIVPVVTGRGCGWGVCTFCSDIVGTAGRTFRSRSPDNVLGEIGHHYATSGVKRFVFVDLKLNSNVDVWRSIIYGIQEVAPGAQWVGAVHVGAKSDQGLTDTDLRAAGLSGCVRLTTGLESGSQRMLALMRKGTHPDRTSAYLRSATAAGISCRCSMIVGYPGETPDDVYATVDFLERHKDVIDRIQFNRLQVLTGTSLHRGLKRNLARFGGSRVTNEKHWIAQVDHHNPLVEKRAHRKAVMQLLAAVHAINRKPLPARARDFEGVM